MFIEIYEAFRRENLRNEGADFDDEDIEPVVFDADVAAMADDLMDEDLIEEAETSKPGKDQQSDEESTTEESAPPRPTPAGRPGRARARRRNAAS